MRELILAFLTWIAGEMGLLTPPPPQVELVSAEEISRIAYGEHQSPEIHLHLQALYDNDKATIYLRNDWNPAELYSRATLLHELVHHVQAFHKIPLPCRRAREPDAYRLTLRWLEQQGVANPYAVLNIDEFTIALLSRCSDE
jgi:hypothetical protein